MNRLARAIAACAGLAVFAAGSLFAVPAAAAASSFSGLTAFGTPGVMVLPGAYDTRLPTAASQALSPRLALDSGYNLDLATRFDGVDTGPNPLISSSFLGLADGGHYGGITYLTAADLRLRLGVSARSDRLDNFAFASLAPDGLPLAFDRNQNQSVLAGASWNISSWVTLGLNAISSVRSGAPLNSLLALPLDQHASTKALDVSARLDLGSNWVTNLDYGQGTTQLSQGSGSEQDETYSFAIAKRGVFGDDAIGFSLSRPAPGMADGFTSLDTLASVPPMILTNSKLLAPETDLQLGYVTTFSNGQLALQTNAAYQMNYKGQTGANAVSILSRVKINF
jgi:hypothetical protein